MAGQVMVVISGSAESAEAAGLPLSSLGLVRIHIETSALQLPGVLASALRELAPALVLVDLEPPEGSVEVVELLRGQPELFQHPVIAFASDEPRCLRARRELPSLPVVYDPLASTELSELALVAMNPEQYPGLFRTWFGAPRRPTDEPAASA